jgi:cytochrome b
MLQDMCPIRYCVRRWPDDLLPTVGIITLQLALCLQRVSWLQCKFRRFALHRLGSRGNSAHLMNKYTEGIMMSKEIRVWDPLVRIFHWSLVVGFTIAYLSGEEESNVHIYAGYMVLGLIIFRVLWGFMGSRYARFSSFVTSPATTLQYLKDLAAKRPQHYIGHNPAGGWMVLALLLCLFVVSLSGLKVYAIEEGLGPLAGDAPALTLVSAARADDDDDDHGHESSKGGHAEDEAAEEFWEELHEVSSNIMLLLIVLHVAGVIVASRLHDEKLVKAMITGKKISKTET